MLIAPIGTRLGLKRQDGEYCPAVVIGVHELTGATIVQTIADPDYANIMARQPGEHAKAKGYPYDPEFDGVTTVVPDGVDWRPAAECVFYRVDPLTAWDPPNREWIVWDPWEGAEALGPQSSPRAA